MSQTTLTSFFNTRKRPASDDIVSSKTKVAHLDRTLEKIKARSTKPILDDKLKSSEDEQKCISLNAPASNLESLKSTSLHEESSVVKRPSERQDFQQNGLPFSKKTNVNVAKNNAIPKSETITAARKELSLGDIRKKLAGSSRLSELKANADRLSKGIQELKAASEQRNLKQFKSIDVELPSSPSKRTVAQKQLLSESDSTPTSPQRPLISPRKVFVSPIKSPCKVPAYIRHASLAASSTSLPLPHQYRFLAELFRGMETVVALLYNRNEKVTFNKLKPSVQEMLKRNFTEKHLAQIKQLVPDFYNFEVQRNKNFSTSSQKETYELVISPNFPTDIKIMNPTVLLERRRYFYNTLLQLVKKHHAQYLLALDPPMIIPEDKLTRWHPEFEIEKVPEVECAKLPELPNAEKLSSAQDVLSKARELFKCNTKMERAMERLAQAKSRGLTEEEKKATQMTEAKSSASTQTSQPATSSLNIINPALRNLPASLLDKVKAKQAAKALEAMTRSSHYEEKYYIYSRLPDLSKTLRNIFVTERKNVLALNIILSKLDSSFKASIPSSELMKDIKILTEEAPEWIKLHEIRKTTYLKLDKNIELKKILTKLEVAAAKYKTD